MRGASYVGALGVFGAYECDVVHVEMDDDGLVPDSARAGDRGDRRRPAGGRKFLYTIPTFHNPAGVTLSTRRRVEILEICRAARPARARGQPLRPAGLRRRADARHAGRRAERVVYLGSFSKTFAPGFRVGWALAPHAVREKLVLAQESATLCPPSFSQLAISAYLSSHDWRSQIKDFTEMYRERRDAMLAALDEQPDRAGDLDGAGRRVLRLAHPARGPGRQGHAAARGHRPGRLRARAPRSTPTASAAGACG